MMEAKQMAEEMEIEATFKEKMYYPKEKNNLMKVIVKI